MTSEASVQAEIRVKSGILGAPLWRNNSGAVTTDDGRHVRFGLGNDSAKLNKVWKSSDLIGITPVRSTAIGQIFGVFTALECKHLGWHAPKNDRERAQLSFLETVNAYGAIGRFVTSLEEYERLFK